MAKMNYEKRAAYEKGRAGIVLDRDAEFNPLQGKKRITYLNVPYYDKDVAKAYGAKWDAEKKKWYCVGDTKDFGRWLGIEEFKDGGFTRLRDYLKWKNPKTNALTRAECMMLYLPWPLEQGWVKTYGDVNIPNEIIKRLKEMKAEKRH
jgi:hypothetical protein